MRLWNSRAQDVEVFSVDGFGPFLTVRCRSCQLELSGRTPESETVAPARGGDIFFSNLEQKSQDFSLRVQGLAYTAYTLHDNNNASNHTSDLIKIPCMI